MKLRKLIIGSVLAVAALTAACFAFAGCGDSEVTDDNKAGDNPSGGAVTVVAEGTGYAEWGKGCYVLYQENSDGSVTITSAWTDYDYATSGPGSEIVWLQEFNGSIEKGLDEDGDPYVKLTVTDYIYTNPDHTPLEGDVYEEYDMTGTVKYEYDPFTSNTYNTTTGEYTIGFAINESGYTKMEYSIDVKPVTTATDVDTWVAGLAASLNPDSSEDSDDSSEDSDDSNVNLDEMNFSISDGVATLTDGWMTLELNSDGTFTCTNLLTSISEMLTDTVTASGTWSISNSVVTLTVSEEGATNFATSGTTYTAFETEASDGTTAYGVTLPGSYGSSELYYTSDNASALAGLLNSANA